MAKVCKNYGQRVQKSVFECTVNEVQYECLKHKLGDIINKKEDSLRIYKMPGGRERNVESFGIDKYVDFEGPLVI